MTNPVRIYVLHHPDSAVGKTLTDRIYEWFRMPSLEGIPVYVRSQPTAGQRVPKEPSGRDETLEYLVPLVDAHMVRDVAWHDYLVSLATKCLKEHDGSTKGWVMFPVAMDGTAFNLPGFVTQRNFVRFMLPVMHSPTEEQNAAARKKATEGVLKDLTEAMSRDLNARLFPKQAGRKLKIFISYARADGGTIPKAMRDYIQGQTQCEAFFDENDIGFGSKYDAVLSKSAGEQARALVVVAGDHYADRPICRWEIRKFTEPDDVPLDGDTMPGRKVYVFHPVMVLSAQSGSRITRVVPELGQSPSLGWEPGREVICFSMLMRAVLFGARNVLSAKQSAAGLTPGLILNRLPGPVALQRLIDEHKLQAPKHGGVPHIHYPGNGLPLMELRLLEATFKKTRFTAFRDVGHHLPLPLKQAMEGSQRPFHEKVIGISYGYSERLNSLGYLPQHLEEALIYLLRPLLRLGADVMYGGNLPKCDQPEVSTVRNMTLTLMNLLNDELSIAGIDGIQEEKGKRTPISPSRLFNPTCWPKTKNMTPENEATWINTCSVIQVLPGHVGLPATEPKEDSPQYFAWRGLVLSRSREMMAEGFACPVPGRPERRVVPAAMIFIGGKITDFSGSMPGIMEEFYWGLRHKRPIFLLGGFGGAAAVLADVMTGSLKSMPDAFRTSHYSREKDYAALLQGYKQLNIPSNRHPKFKLSWLWKELVRSREYGASGLCRNGLSEQDNRTLLTTTDTLGAVHLVWKGLSHMVTSEKPRIRKRSHR